MTGLSEWHRRPNATAPWKLIILTPRMLLRPTADDDGTGKAQFETRMRKYLRGEWETLLREASEATRPTKKPRKVDQKSEGRRHAAAEAKIRLREITKAKIF